MVQDADHEFTCDACQWGVIEKMTIPVKVRRSDKEDAPLLVLVHQVPARRCYHCGHQLVSGSLIAALERDLAQRFQQGERIPAQMDFEHDFLLAA